jgi:hypothetical protein
MNLCQQAVAPTLTDWLQAIGTLGAVLAAFFFFFWERIRNWWKRPVLYAILNFRPPDCHRITPLVTLPTGGTITPDAFWFRITIGNSGKTPAKDLEIIINEVEQKIGDSWQTYSAFLPNNLKWTHVGLQYLPMLLPGTEKNADLGHIIDPHFRPRLPWEENTQLPVPANDTVFCFEVTAVPTNKYHIVAPGEYRFSLTVGAANCSPIKARCQFTLSGQWHRDEASMFQRGIVLTAS